MIINFIFKYINLNFYYCLIIFNIDLIFIIINQFAYIFIGSNPFSLTTLKVSST